MKYNKLVEILIEGMEKFRSTGATPIACRGMAIKQAEVLSIFIDKEIEKDVPFSCGDPGHDDRWCSACNGIRDGIDIAQQKIKERIIGKNI